MSVIVCSMTCLFLPESSNSVSRGVLKSKREYKSHASHVEGW